MIKVCIIGGGNVAFHLAYQFIETDQVQLVQLYNRTICKLNPFLNSVSITDDLNTLAEADIYIIASSDVAIHEISNQLPFNNRLVVHTSGSEELLSLSNKNRRGVFYPLQSLSKSKPIDFSEIPICIEAENDKDLVLLHTLASALSSKVYNISSEQRKYLHVSAVFVNNFVNHLYHIASQICVKKEIAFEILMPLIKETADKINYLSPKLAQTGPAIRNDNLTIENHLKLLSTKEKEIYQLLTSSIKDVYKTRK